MTFISAVGPPLEPLYVPCYVITEKWGADSDHQGVSNGYRDSSYPAVRLAGNFSVIFKDRQPCKQGATKPLGSRPVVRMGFESGNVKSCYFIFVFQAV